MVKRKTIGKKLRFEVFKRDSFQCQYCGRSAPDVVLHVDHILPVKHGGETTIMNLVTSCFDCNSGKSHIKLSDSSEIQKQKVQLKELNERRLQLQMMVKWRDELSLLEDEKLRYIVDEWSKKTGNRYYICDSGEKTVRKWMKKWTVSDILSAIDASASQYLKTKNGVIDPQTVDTFFEYIPRILSCRGKFEAKPYLKDLMYIRGIMRNRFSYVNQTVAIKWLEEAYIGGMTPQELTDIVLSSKNWTEWRYEMRNHGYAS